MILFLLFFINTDMSVQTARVHGLFPGLRRRGIYDIVVKEKGDVDRHRYPLQPPFLCSPLKKERKS
jgi:hypothetical protein